MHQNLNKVDPIHSPTENRSQQLSCCCIRYQPSHSPPPLVQRTTPNVPAMEIDTDDAPLSSNRILNGTGNASPGDGDASATRYLALDTNVLLNHSALVRSLYQCMLVGDAWLLVPSTVVNGTRHHPYLTSLTPRTRRPQKLGKVRLAHVGHDSRRGRALRHLVAVRYRPCTAARCRRSRTFGTMERRRTYPSRR